MLSSTGETLRKDRKTLKWQQSFDVIHLHGPWAGPQDGPAQLRHYDRIQSRLTHGDKPLSVHAEGRAQTVQSFKMIRLAHRIDEAEFDSGVWSSTVINSNSPRRLNYPVTRGINDFARVGQMSRISPFCLAGAMAPITIAGALTLQLAEALVGITLRVWTRSRVGVLWQLCLHRQHEIGSASLGPADRAAAAVSDGAA